MISVVLPQADRIRVTHSNPAYTLPTKPPSTLLCFIWQIPYQPYLVARSCGCCLLKTKGTLAHIAGLSVDMHHHSVPRAARLCAQAHRQSRKGTILAVLLRHPLCTVRCLLSFVVAGGHRPGSLRRIGLRKERCATGAREPTSALGWKRTVGSLEPKVRYAAESGRSDSPLIQAGEATFKSAVTAGISRRVRIDTRRSYAHKNDHAL